MFLHLALNQFTNLIINKQFVFLRFDKSLINLLMGRDHIVEKVNAFLIDEFELEPDQLIPEASMKDDLDIESLDFVDIAVIIEKEFKLKVTSEQMVKINKLDDLYNFILEAHKN